MAGAQRTSRRTERPTPGRSVSPLHPPRPVLRRSRRSSPSPRQLPLRAQLLDVRSFRLFSPVGPESFRPPPSGLGLRASSARWIFAGLVGDVESPHSHLPRRRVETRIRRPTTSREIRSGSVQRGGVGAPQQTRHGLVQLVDQVGVLVIEHIEQRLHGVLIAAPRVIAEVPRRALGPPEGCVEGQQAPGLWWRSGAHLASPIRNAQAGRRILNRPRRCSGPAMTTPPIPPSANRLAAGLFALCGLGDGQSTPFSSGPPLQILVCGLNGRRSGDSASVEPIRRAASGQSGRSSGRRHMPAPPMNASRAERRQQPHARCGTGAGS